MGSWGPLSPSTSVKYAQTRSLETTPNTDSDTPGQVQSAHCLRHRQGLMIFLPSVSYEGRNGKEHGNYYNG